VESSTNLTFGPYNFKYPKLEEHSDSALLVGEFTDDEGKVQTKVNHWNQIFDFTKKADGELNFEFVKPEDFSIVTA